MNDEKRIMKNQGEMKMSENKNDKIDEKQNEMKSIDLLVAEDTPENMDAARQYFEGLKGKNLVCLRIRIVKLGGIRYYVADGRNEFRTLSDYNHFAFDCQAFSRVTLPEYKRNESQMIAYYQNEERAANSVLEVVRSALNNPNNQQEFIHPDAKQSYMNARI